MANKRALSTADLEQHLREQLDFLHASADNYDGGFTSEAKRLATAIRVLVHDSRQSRSLLGQLDKKSIPFLNSAWPLVPGNVATHGGLVTIAMGGPNDGYVAMLDAAPVFGHLSFDEWWNAHVFVDERKNVLTRRDLVLIAANQDGGAHVDPELDEIYARLAKENSLAWKNVGPRGERPLHGGEKAAIRQIAHEVLKSLKPEYEKRPNHRAQAYVGGVSVRNLTTEEKLRLQMPTVGRNDPCPCGSGKKYKKCHGAPA